MILALLLACTKDEGVGPITGDSAVATDSGSDSGSGDDTGELQDWAELERSCSAPGDLMTDTLAYEGGHQITQEGPGGGFFIEIVDLEKDGDRIYSVGQGGLIVFDFSDPATADELGYWPPARNTSGRYHRVEKIGTDVVAVVHRDEVLEFIDVSDPTDPQLLDADEGAGREGLAAVGERLYISDRSDGGQLEIWDISDVSSPSKTTVLSGFPSSTWELAKSGDGWLYAADQSQGVVPISLSDPDAPEPGQPTGEHSVLHIDVDGDWLYAAMGSHGVGVFDRSDPAAPTLVATLPVASSAVQVAASGGYLFTADHEGLVAWDISDPTNAQVVGHQESEQFALAVMNEGATAWLGDWSILGQWALSPGAPELAMSSEFIQLPTDGGSTEVTLTNFGSATLEIVGGTAPDGLTLETRRTTLDSATSADLKLTWQGGDLDSTICLASNDPDEPVREVIVVSGDNASYLGGTAPDFTLPDLDGNSWRLSEQLGHPVVLAYFATW